MEQDDIIAVEKAANELLHRFKKLREFRKAYPHSSPVVLGGAIRRASMELTRALADLRDPYRRRNGGQR